MENVDCYLLKNKLEQPADFESAEFNELCRLKIICILSSLENYNEILWVDSDVVFFKNVLEDIKSYTHDMIFQDDILALCAGFFAVRKTPTTISFLKRVVTILTNKTYAQTNWHDQTVINNLFIETDNIRIIKLPISEYPCGKAYFDNNNRVSALMVHNNYIVGTENKINRFKEYALWNPSDEAFDECKKIYI